MDGLPLPSPTQISVKPEVWLPFCAAIMIRFSYDVRRRIFLQDAPPGGDPRRFRRPRNRVQELAWLTVIAFVGTHSPWLPAVSGAVPGTAPQVPPPLHFTASTQRLAVGANVASMALGDLDNDGDLDLVLGVFQGPSQVWVNQGGLQRMGAGGTIHATGTFGLGQHTLPSTAGSCLAIADIERDGDADILIYQVLADGTSVGLSWLANQGGFQGGALGQFLDLGHPVGLPRGGPTAMVQGVFSTAGGDAFVVGLTGQGTLGYLFEDYLSRLHQFSFAQPRPVSLPIRDTKALAAGDLDGDGLPDIVLAGAGVGLLLTADRIVPGSFRSEVLIPGPGEYWAVKLADLDGDGDLDLALGAYNRSDEYWLNQGNAQGGRAGEFRFAGNFGPTFGWTTSLEAADFDKDGRLDLVAVRAGSAHIYRNQGDGSFNQIATLEDRSDTCRKVVVGDLDKDGYQDLALDFGQGVQVWWCRPETPSATRPVYDVELYAGTGTEGVSGDGGPAIQATLTRPAGLAVDASGTVFISDAEAHVVRRVDSRGIIRRVAGIGVRGFSGDGGPATNAALWSPTGLAMDGQQNLYICDTENHRVRKVDRFGRITTFAGNGSLGTAGDGGPAASAELSGPSEIAFDQAGNAWIGTGNWGNQGTSEQPLRRVDPTGVIRSVATLPRLRGMAVRGSEALVVADAGRLLTVSSSGAVSSQDLGWLRLNLNGGALSSVDLRLFTGLAVDALGQALVADGEHACIRRLSLDGRVDTLVGGQVPETPSYPPTWAGIGLGSALAVSPSGDLFVTEPARHWVRRFRPTAAVEALHPVLATTPMPGWQVTSLLTRGQNYYTSDPVEGDPSGPWYEFRFPIRNAGNTDLLIERVEFAPRHPHSHLIGQSQFTVYAGEQDKDVRLRFMATNLLQGLTIPMGTLAIWSNDPAQREAVWDVFIGLEPTPSIGEVVETVFGYLKVSGGAAASFGPQLLSASGGVGDVGTLVFGLDEASPHSLKTVLPATLGGGEVTISNFSGTATVTAVPVVGDDSRRHLTISSGTFTAASFQLPSGLSTGPNTLTFVPGGASEGFLVRSNGGYTLRANAVITNALFPGGLPVVGSYSGVFDPTHGAATVKSDSTDLVQEARHGLYISRYGDSYLIRWPSLGSLQQSTNVLGPWYPIAYSSPAFITNATTRGTRYFRVLQSP